MKIIPSIAIAIYSISAFADPVQFDVEGAHIIVLRPMDSYSGNKSYTNQIAENLKEHVAAFNYQKGDKQISGHPPVFCCLSKDPLVQSVNTEVESKGFKLHHSGVVYQLQKPSTIQPSDFPILVDNQQQLYERFVIEQGNPDNLTAKSSFKKFIGGVLSVGTLALIGDKYGTNTAQAALNAKLPDDIYRVATLSKGAVAPLLVPDFNPSNYQSIDVRRVTTLGNDDRFGQIIIAYKTEKTAELEQLALTKAVVSIVGVDTTLSAVQDSQKKDFDRRKAIWESSNHE